MQVMVIVGFNVIFHITHTPAAPAHVINEVICLYGKMCMSVAFFFFRFFVSFTAASARLNGSAFVSTQWSFFLEMYEIHFVGRVVKNNFLFWSLNLQSCRWIVINNNRSKLPEN